jgi:hypothetical protein
MELTIVKSEHMDDWYLIERAEHDGREWIEQIGPNASTLRCSSRFSDADVEGHGCEMLAIADAIDAKASEHFKRCAVDVNGDEVRFWSPRNSQEDGVVTYDEAKRLAEKIREVVKPVTA